MNAYCEKEYLVDSRDVDLFGMLRPSALMGDLQDLATIHAWELNMAREQLIEKYGVFWMLARAWYRLERPVLSGETLRIRTSHRGGREAVVYRDFDILVGDEPVGEAVTAWVIAKLDGHSMVLPRKIAEIVNSPLPEHTKTKKLGHMKAPQNLELLEERTVRYSDTDINGHMNNIRYLDVACDAVSYETMRGQYLSELHINYLKECFAGQQLQILGCRIENGWFVRGADDSGAAHFDMTLNFSPAAGNETAHTC